MNDEIVHINDSQDVPGLTCPRRSFSHSFKEKVIIHKCSCGKVLEIRIKEVNE